MTEPTVDYDFARTGYLARFQHGYDMDFVREAVLTPVWTCQRCLCLTPSPAEHFTAMHLADSVLGVEDLVIER